MRHPERILLGIMLSIPLLGVVITFSYLIGTHGEWRGGYLLASIIIGLGGLVGAFFIVKTVSEVGLIDFLTASRSTPELDIPDESFTTVSFMEDGSLQLFDRKAKSGFAHIYGRKVSLNNRQSHQLLAGGFVDGNFEMQSGTHLIRMIKPSGIMISDNRLIIRECESIIITENSLREIKIKKGRDGGIIINGDHKWFFGASSGYFDNKKPGLYLELP